jgi:putative ABC transport system substrate-binding protein
MTTSGGLALAATVSRLTLGVVISLLAAALAAEAQPAGKVYRIGYLAYGSSTTTLGYRSLDAFRQGLRELGWIEGQNITIDHRFAEGRFDRLPDFAAELVRLKVDVMVSVSTPATLAAKRATTTIPIVLVAAADPVGSKIVGSLARPGANVTGVATHAGLEIGAKRLELLKEAIPNVTRVAALGNPTSPEAELLAELLPAAARTLGLTLQSIEVREPKDLERAFAAIARERPHALLVLEGAVAILHRRQIIGFAARERLPTVYGIREFVDDGGLMSYGVSLPDLFPRAAVYVDKILRGAKPGDLPVEQPTKFELVINLKTAKALRLTIPPSLLLRADQVIE